MTGYTITGARTYLGLDFMYAIRVMFSTTTPTLLMEQFHENFGVSRAIFWCFTNSTYFLEQSS